MKYAVTLLITLFFLTKIHGQKVYDVSFKDGSIKQITVNNSVPELISDANFGITLFNFRLLDKGAAGPFVLGLSYQKFLLEKKHIVEASILATPIEAEYLTTNGPDKLMFMHVDLNYKYVFNSRTAEKIKELNFYDPQKSHGRVDVWFV
jgi:hypothetical protein